MRDCLHNGVVLLSALVQTSAEVGSTRSRLAKRAAIACAIQLAAPDEVATVVTYLSGTLRQRRTGIGWASYQSAAEAADEPRLTVAEVDAAFERISALSGAGSREARREALRGLLSRATGSEQEFLWRLATEELRQGALDGVMQDAVADAFGVPAPLVRRAAMLLGSTAAAAEIAQQGAGPLEHVGLVVGVPVRPMLAASAPDVPAAFGKVAAGGEVLVDRKLDGIRIQVHRDGRDVRLFTRSLDDITDRLPEVVEVVSALPAQRLVLDGEAIVLRPDGRPEPFQVTAARTASRSDAGTLRSRSPVSTLFFDILHRDGRDLLEQPLDERLGELAAVVPPQHRMPSIRTSSREQAQAYFDTAVAAGHEGVIVKASGSAYDAGRRGSAWVKVKPRHTLDLVVLAAEWGHGRRSGWLSNLHLGARNAADGSWVMLGKTFKGLTDALLTWQTERLLMLEVRRTQGTVYVRPELVVEVAFDGIQASPRYPGGVALRFARVLRYRDDKSADEADTIDTVLALHAAP